LPAIEGLDPKTDTGIGGIIIERMNDMITILITTIIMMAITVMALLKNL